MIYLSLFIVSTLWYNAPNTVVFAHQTLVFHLWQLNKTQCKRLLINTHLLAANTAMVISTQRLFISTQLLFMAFV